MKTYIVLLRGINIGNHHKVKMAELRSQLESVGFLNVQSYIQSGNVIFESAILNKTQIKQKLIALLSTHYDFDIPIQVYTKRDLQHIIDNNPYDSSSEEKVKQLHVTLLSSSPSLELIDVLAKIDTANDTFEVINNAVYIHCEGPYHKTKLGNSFIEKKLSCEATTRTWRTIIKIMTITP
ncbi:DUF1697 domain-containing protein [Halosquirtibacter xylanolyticus]|uniref:DUF1697 domain-containing protein n=1 Tax=Halosquirtibacter xylanolyticus TaxID=3374599 RepID=UPI00374898B2|nr:DUF1697 domain-containing protein [Prolixibacteraceae bacterium]